MSAPPPEASVPLPDASIPSSDAGTLTPSASGVQPRVTATEFTDAACPWAWGSEPVFRLLRHGLRPFVQWRRVCGILFDEGDDPAPDPAAEARWYEGFIKDVSAHTRAPYTLRRHAAGVTVITVPGPAGFTATSFTSVSLRPPLVSFYLGLTASTARAVDDATRFAVHVLGTQDAALAPSVRAQRRRPLPGRGMDRVRRRRPPGTR
ncbi:flavin reductase family protein [Streptomyces sp. SYP-A7185]|uniref:flavin reductase family protein n=1 Tax=Streptomyces sp. SYP-A7185 TaxID=3040076 RepID=UPI0038F77247